ncbi:hypothetical protein LTR86_002083 [Recurvomyces mirabilis]|nr:hypothetical protein LTR86_002083 [Recurvomyces mirabilis]
MFIHFLLATITLTLAAPTPSNCPVEDTPWDIRDLVAFQAAPGANAASYIKLHFCDQNTGLELETECSRTLAVGSSDSPIDTETWYPCDNADVRFKYGGDTVWIERAFTSPCLGPPPYDGAIAYGQAGTDVVNTTSAAGSTCTQDQFVMEITSESG